MKLYTFAHRGEAAHFLKKEHFRPVQFYFEGLYQNDQDLLLITGEGLQTTTEKLAAVSAIWREKIKEIFNLGVAGRLDSRLQLGEVYSIRSIYAEQEKGDRRGDFFTSFSTSSSNSNSASPSLTANPDCLTARTRVLDRKLAERLSYFAPIVDRELWAVASVAKLFKIPFQSFKLLVDDPVTGEIFTRVNRVSENEVESSPCQTIRDHSYLLSKKLYDHVSSSLQLPPSTFNKQTPIGPSDFSESLHKHFYFTTTQDRQLHSLLQSLSITSKESSNSLEKRINPLIQEISSLPLSPKKRSSLLLQKLTSLLTPFDVHFQRQLDKHCLPLKKGHFRVSTDPLFEDSTLHLSAKIQSEKDLVLLRQALSEFSYEPIDKLFQGEISFPGDSHGF